MTNCSDTALQPRGKLRSASCGIRNATVFPPQKRRKIMHSKFQQIYSRDKTNVNLVIDNNDLTFTKDAK
jgi:hypothetical protein